MLTHINVICLHISAKSRTFAEEKARETNLSQTQKPKNYELPNTMHALHFSTEELHDH